jgi:hypothetical protein
MPDHELLAVDVDLWRRLNAQAYTTVVYLDHRQDDRIVKNQALAGFPGKN